jgi:hypothetical protein
LQALKPIIRARLHLSLFRPQCVSVERIRLTGGCEPGQIQ